MSAPHTLGGLAGRRAIFAVTLACVSVGSVAQAGAALVGDPVAGRVAYEARCSGCHSIDTNRVGPLHRGVVGRRPGTAANYDYSPAVRRLTGVWTPVRLDQWLQGPQKLAPGARMYLSVADPVQRRNIVAYLQTVSMGPARH